MVDHGEVTVIPHSAKNGDIIKALSCPRCDLAPIVKEKDGFYRCHQCDFASKKRKDFFLDTYVFVNNFHWRRLQ